MQPDRRDHHLLVHQLLDAVTGRLAPLPGPLAGLLQEEPIDVRVAPVYIGAAAGDERLDPRRRVAERAASALDEALELLLGPSLEEGGPLDRPKLHSDTRRVQIVDHGLADIRDPRV